MKLLLAKGANIEARDNKGNTALKVAKLSAATYGTKTAEIVKLLKEKGAH